MGAAVTRLILMDHHQLSSHLPAYHLFQPFSFEGSETGDWKPPLVSASTGCILRAT